MTPADRERIARRLELVALELRVTLAESINVDFRRLSDTDPTAPETFIGRSIARLERWAKDLDEVRAVLNPMPPVAAASVGEALEEMPDRPKFGGPTR